MASTLTETRQFYILYNTLEDQKAFMEKEVASYMATFDGSLILVL